MKPTNKTYRITKKYKEVMELLREIESWNEIESLNKPKPAFSMRAALAEIKRKLLEDRNF